MNKIAVLLSGFLADNIPVRVAAALPAIAHTQQETPTIGFLSTREPDEAENHTNAFRRGLEEMGYVEGRNINIEYRWAKGDYGQLPSFAADLRGKQVALMVRRATRQRWRPRLPRHRLRLSFSSAEIRCNRVLSKFLHRRTGR